MGEDNVIELPARRCKVCGVTLGTRHKPECPRSPEFMRAIGEKRERMYEAGELERPHKRVRRGRQAVDDVTKTAAEMLYGDRASAVAVLRKQMASKDEKVAQNAAKMILAYTDGTPTQKIESTVDNVSVVEYRSVALRHEDGDEFVPGLADVGA